MDGGITRAHCATGDKQRKEVTFGTAQGRAICAGWCRRVLYAALAEGKLPEQVLAELLRDDAQRDKRQLAIINMSGRAANRNPSQADPSGIWWGAVSGKYYACQGNNGKSRFIPHCQYTGLFH